MKETSTGYVVQRKVDVVAIASHRQHDKSGLADSDSQVLCNMRHTFCALHNIYFIAKRVHKDVNKDAKRSFFLLRCCSVWDV